MLSLRTASFDVLGTVGTATFEPLAEYFYAGRLDEEADSVISIILLDIYASLNIHIK
jgi:hypothetical protein